MSAPENLATTREIEAEKRDPWWANGPDDGEPAEVEIRRTRFGWSAKLKPARAPHCFRLEYTGGIDPWRRSRKAIERKAQRMLAKERRSGLYSPDPVEIVR